jgi:hypothetical protein
MLCVSLRWTVIMETSYWAPTSINDDIAIFDAVAIIGVSVSDCMLCVTHACARCVRWDRFCVFEITFKQFALVLLSCARCTMRALRSLNFIVTKEPSSRVTILQTVMPCMHSIWVPTWQKKDTFIWLNKVAWISRLGRLYPIQSPSSPTPNLKMWSKSSATGMRCLTFEVEWMNTAKIETFL